MQREITILCPNCTEPIILTPDKSILETIACARCETKHDVIDLNNAKNKKERNKLHG